MTIKNIRETGQRRTEITRITLLEKDGSETIINVSEAIHFIFGFAKSDPKKPSAENEMEIMVYGVEEILGEMYYQMGRQAPFLVNYCVGKAKENMAKVIVAEIKRSGIDPIGEAMKTMSPPAKKEGWN